MEVEASNFLKLGYISVGVSISWDSNNSKKKITFKQLWQNATEDTCLSFFKTTDNGIALLTGEANDLYVIDCDIPKQKDIDLGVACGVTTFEKLSRIHGMSADVPVQQSASGGKHYFFSLSKSQDNGLITAKNQTKIRVENSATTIDARGERGCIIVSPTSYIVHADTKKYEFHSPLVAKGKLPSLPLWCINLLNNSTPTPSTEIKTLTIASSPSSPIQKTKVFKHITRPIVETQFDTHFQHIYDREHGYDGSFSEKKPCVLCDHVHRSNNYMVRQIVEAVYFVRNYSTSCKSGAFNWEDNILLNSVIETPYSDEPYAKILKEVLRSRGIELVFTRNHGFLCFNGHYWEDLDELIVAREVRSICGTILEMLYKNIRIPQTTKGDGATTEEKNILIQKVNKFRMGRSYIKKAANVNAILACYKQLFFDTKIEDLLDTNKDILVVKNGVIDLQTGCLRDGREDDYMTRLLDVTYNQDRSTSDIDVFFDSIFSAKKDMIEYIHRLLGYAITGHTSEQVWCIFTGEGSNGKSLLMSIIEKLLGKLYVTAPHEIFFKSDRKTQAGGATAHLAVLKGARICVKEEADPKDVLNIETIKILSGESTITSRGLYEKVYTSFVSNALPILLCNHKPAFDVDDYAMLRRIIVVPFDNIYTSVDDPQVPYDPHNPRHQVRDNNLRKKLMLDDCQEQLLTWLVRGAVKWYALGLGEQPQAINNALKVYCSENDKLTQFIEDHCQVGREHRVHAGRFREFYNYNTNTKISQNGLAEMMEKRGYSRVKIMGTRMYSGLKLVHE